MFPFKKKTKKLETSNINPLKLPVIPNENITPETIAKYIKNDIPVWAWYNIFEEKNNNRKINCNAYYALENGRFDEYVMYRKEDALLCKYRIIIFENNPYLKPVEIREMKNSNIMDIVNDDFCNTSQCYYDNENLAGKLYAIPYDITQEEALLYLKSHRVMYIGDEHFSSKKENTNVKN